MKKRILSFLLALVLFSCLAASISPHSFAVETGASETEQDRRDKVVDYMYRMCTVAWTPSHTINSAGCSCGHNYTFKAGQTYYGLPYTHKCGSLERMESYIGEDNIIDTSEFPAVGYNGWDYLLGNDCADAVFWAWSQITDDISYLMTEDMLDDPAIKPVGNFAFANGSSVTDNVTATFNKIGNVTPKTTAHRQAVYACYAQVQKGDCLLQKGHARLAGGDAYVVENPDGTINGEQSYILIYEQGAQAPAYFNAYHSTCNVGMFEGYDNKISFADLYTGSGRPHIPVTIDAFENGDTAVTATMRQGATTQGGLPLGTIYSTGRINYVTINICEGDRVVKSNTVYPCLGAHNTTYTIDESALYYGNDGNPLTCGNGQTYELWINDRSGTIKVGDIEAKVHTSHCVCGGDGVGAEGHSCEEETLTWKPFVWDSNNKNIKGNYYLTGDTQITSGAIGFAGDINICLNGFRMYNSNARVFYSSNIGTNYKLSICDCSEEKTGTIENQSTSSTSNGAIVGVSYTSSGSAAALDITLWGGNYVYSCGKARSSGGLFYIHKGSSLKIYKANLVGGQASGDGGLISANNASEVIIYGGTFSGGNAANGGNIYINGGVLTLAGGTVTGGNATNGGNIYMNAGVLKLIGGTIADGTATTGKNIYIGANATMVASDADSVAAGTVATASGGKLAIMETVDVILNPGKAGMGFSVQVTGTGVTEYGVKLTVEGNTDSGPITLGIAAGTNTVWLDNLYVAGHEDAKVTAQVYVKVGGTEYVGDIYTTSMQDLISVAWINSELTHAQLAALRALAPINQ